MEVFERLTVDGRFTLRIWSEEMSGRRIGIGLGLLLSIVGCSKTKEPWEIVYPVEGSVSYQGKPLANAHITLIPKDEGIPTSVRPTGRSDEDGVFTLGTYSVADGAPLGDYKVLVMRFPVVISKTNAVSGPNDLPQKYSRPDTSDLSVTIDEGQDQLSTLELK